MPTTGKILGKNLRFLKGGTAITHALEGSLQRNRDMLPATTKDSGDDKEFMAGEKEWNISCNGMVAWDGAENYEEVETAYENGTTLTMRATTGVIGDPYWEGSVLINTLNLRFANNEIAIFDFTGQGTAGTTKGTET